RVVVGKIARTRSLVWRDRVLPLATLKHVARPRKRRDEPLTVAKGVATGVVEVKVRVDHESDVLTFDAEGLQLVEQAGRLIDPEYLSLAFAELRPGARLYEDDVIGVADEQAVHIHAHAIALVRLLLPLPEHLGHDPEHCAAVDAKHAIAEDPHVETADAHEASVWAAVEIRDLRQSDGDALRALWRACGIRDRPGDDDASLEAMSSRNPGLCILGVEGGRVVGSALAGFDGRRGWLYHVATH